LTFNSHARRALMSSFVVTICLILLGLSLPASALEAGRAGSPKAGPLEADPLESCATRFRDLQRAPFNYVPRSLIATLPDPIASPFAREFDILFLALQQGMAHEGFVQDIACLTWSQAAKPAEGSVRSFDAGEEPSVVLFRREKGMAPDDDGGSAPDDGGSVSEGGGSVPEVYAVLLVGELPHTGVRSGAMGRALELARKGGDFAAAPDDANAADSAAPIRILGPSFSGSARSLAVALRGQLEGDPPRIDAERSAGASELLESQPASGSITIRSGTATDGGLTALFEELLDGAVSFASLGTSNEDLQRCVWNRLVPERLGLRTRWKPEAADEERKKGGACAPTVFGSGEDNSRVALLVESSVYGRDFEEGRFHVVPFPTHIGALRDAYQKIGARSRKAGADETSPEAAATLPFVAGGGSLQGLPAFGQHATLSSQDLVLNRSLRQLARRRTQVVAIIATNTADKLFLAEKVRTFAPDARLITFEGDVLLGHPDALPTTGGMLVASSSPLEEPDPFLAAPAAGVQLLFDFDGAQGVYRAVIDLVREGDQRPAGQVVVSVVAKRGLLALDRYEVGEGHGNAAGDGGASAESMAAVRMRDGIVRSSIGWGNLRLTPERLPMLWSLILLIASLLLGLVAWWVRHDLKEGNALLGLVPVELVAPHRWGRPQSGDRILHALVVLFPLCWGLPYFVLAVPALARESATDSMMIAGLPGSVLGYLVNFCLFLLAAVLIYLLAGLTVRTWLDLRSLRRSEPRDVPPSLAAQAWVALPLVVVIVCVLLALHAGKLCIGRLWADAGSAGSLLVARTLSLSGGMSPLLPAILMAAVVLGWAMLVLRRREELYGICPERDRADLLPTPDGESRLLRLRYGRLWAAIDPLGGGRAYARWWVLLVVVPMIYLCSLYGQMHFASPLRGIEGQWFDRGMSFIFLLILMLLVAAGVSLWQGWLALKDFVLSAGELVDGAPLKHSPRPPSLEPLCNAFGKLAQRSPKQTAALRARLLAASCGTGTLWLQVVLWLRCGESKAKSRQAAVATAQLYAAAGASFLVRQAYRQLRHLMVFLTVSLIVLFFAVSSYAFEPRRVLLVYLGLLMIGAAVICVWIVVRAKGDELLGKLAGFSETGGGWVPLTQRLSLFAGLPALSLLAGRFPELRQILGDWVEPLVNALR
jgi:hypothetical protein